MPDNPISRIILVGMPGSGKTTVGKKLADKLQYSFLDTDKLIETTLKAGIGEIFRTKGELFFRETEKQLLKEYPFPLHSVLATGGGLPCEDENATMLKSLGTTVYLQQSPQILYQRLLQNHGERPLLQGKNKEEVLQYLVKTLHKRQPFYERADIIITSSEDCVEILAQMLQTVPSCVNIFPK